MNTRAGCASVDCWASESGYQRGCRGTACTKAASNARRSRMRNRRRPDAVLVPLSVSAGSVRLHVEELRAAGLGLDAIAKAARVSRWTLRQVCTGELERVRPKTKERILAVMPGQLAGGVLVDAREAQAQLDALSALGVHARVLARAVYGADTKSPRVTLGPRARQRTVARIAALYVEHFGTIPALDPLASLFAALVPEPSADYAWRQEAACLRLDGDGHQRSAPFFPERGSGVMAARTICKDCTVKLPCLDYALVTEAQGVWGATTGEERRLIARHGLSASEALAMQAESPQRGLVGILTEREQAAVNA